MKFKINKTAEQKGDNDFLSHSIYEIQIDGDIIGGIRTSEYDHVGAKKTPKDWLAKPKTFLSAYKNYLFHCSHNLARLPDEINNSLIQKAPALIVDKIILKNKYKNVGLEYNILREFITLNQTAYSVLFLPNFDLVSQSMSLTEEESLHFFQERNWTLLDAWMAVYYLDKNSNYFISNEQNNIVAKKKYKNNILKVNFQ